MKSGHINQMKTDQRGFTLFELFIVLLIAAVLVVWGFPSLIQSIQNNQVASQNMSLIAMLNLTKSEAIRRNTDVNMVLENTEGGWNGIIEDPSEEADVEGCVEGQLRCSFNENAALTICDENLADCDTSHQIVFNNRGYIIDPLDPTVWAVTTMFLQHERCSGQNQRRRIDILPSGQITSCSLPCDSTAVCP
jgi:type IV fimbrial biogenesis protein FimT